MTIPQKPKVLVVGLDGATFDVIQPMISEGRLPNLSRLMREGSWCRLRSTVPPISPTAWTTFATGKNPGKHGVFDFRTLDRDYAFTPQQMQQQKHKTILRLLSEADRHIISVDVPFTFPPEAVNGMVISGYPTPRTEGTVYFHPPDLPEKLRGAGFELTLGWPEDRIDVHPDFFSSWEDVMIERERLLTHLIHQEPWDLFMVVFGITDTLAHTLWHYLEPAHPSYRDDQSEVYREALLHGYELADHALGTLWSMIDEDTHLVVLSDHGFGSIRPRQWLFRFLEDHGWLEFKSRTGVGRFTAPLRKIALRLYTEVGWLRRAVRELRPGAKGKLRKTLTQGGLLIEARNLDFATSPTIPSDMGTHLYLNRKDRFSGGFLSIQEADRLSDTIRAAMLSARDPVDGLPIVSAVYKGSEVYTGDETMMGPDLIIEYANHFSGYDQPRPMNPRLTGGHVPDGILLAWGPAIDSKECQELDIDQLAPTMLHLLEEPVPPDMDGHVATPLFKPSWLAQHTVEIGDQPAIRDTEAIHTLTEDEQAEVEKQLRALGYIE